MVFIAFWAWAERPTALAARMLVANSMALECIWFSLPNESVSAISCAFDHGDRQRRASQSRDESVWAGARDRLLTPPGRTCDRVFARSTEAAHWQGPAGLDEE
jgi:hypothetical protein